MNLPKYDRKAVGFQALTARKAAGLTQDKVAERFGCSLRHIVEAECGTAGMSVDFLLALCKAYNITPNDMLNEKLTAPKLAK